MVLKKKAIVQKRKRILLRHTINMLFLIWICITGIVLGILFWVMPKKEISETENRSLADFPETSIKTIASGEFTSGMNLYYSDNFVFRDQLVKAKFALEDRRGLRIDDVKIYDAGGNSSENTSGEKAPVLSKDNYVLLVAEQVKTAEKMLPINLDDPYYKDPSKHFDVFDKNSIDDKFSDYLNMDKNLLEGEQRGNLFVIGDTALEIFYGNEKVSADFADVINAYHLALGNEVTLYTMIIPNHFEYGLPEKYKGKIGRAERPFMDLVKNRLNADILFVDIYDTLKEHYDAGEYLYFRTDHHWTGLGAYRAYEIFCNYAGLIPTPLESYEKRISTGFLGTLYNSCLDKNLAANPDIVEYYVTDLPYKQTNIKKDGSSYAGTLTSEYSDGRTNGYLTFMGGDIPLAKIETESTSGRNIIVFKESYGNAFIPFLVPHYETVYVADIRSFPYNAIDFIRENDITEALFLGNVMTSNTAARVANILGLMTK